jgi:alcohol/geraniol dehydrogenase (NADP+)
MGWILHRAHTGFAFSALLGRFRAPSVRSVSDNVSYRATTTKHEEALKLGAHQVVNSRQSSQMEAISGSLDFVLSTVNVPLDWNAILGTLGPKGRLHLVGVVLQPLEIPSFPLIAMQRSVSGSPLGSPATTSQMLDFSARHGIEPVIEVFPMSQVNDALEHLKAGKARYRVVLKNDL